MVLQSTGVERTSILTAYWEQNLNIKTTLKVVDYSTFVGLVYGRVYTQMCSASAGYTDPVAQMLFYLSNSFYNYECYVDPAMDKMINDMSTTADPALLNRQLKDLNIYFLTHRPPIAFPLEYTWIFWQPWLKNYGGSNCVGYGLIGPIWARAWLDQDMKYDQTGQK